jgi:hypothetical protein
VTRAEHAALPGDIGKRMKCSACGPRKIDALPERYPYGMLVGMGGGKDLRLKINQTKLDGSLPWSHRPPKGR